MSVEPVEDKDTICIGDECTTLRRCSLHEAAPALLRALEEYFEDVNLHDTNWFRRARAAIAAAKGES